VDRIFVSFALDPSSSSLPWLLCTAAGIYLLALFANPARHSLRDGFRAIRRYPMLWLPLGVCGFGYALFQLALRVYFYCVLPAADRPIFMWWRAAGRDPQFRLTGSPESLWYLPPGIFAGIRREALLPALENVAGIFNNLVSTFPLAAIAAVLLLINRGGHHGVLWRALRHRFKSYGLLVYAGIFLCALAAIAKPFLYIFARDVDPFLWFQWAPVVVWLAFLFEYLLGVCIQIYLILLAYCWVRGINFTHRHLLDFAIRRFSFVVKWAAIVMLLSSVFIDLPLILKNFAPFAGLFTSEGPKLEFRLGLARAILTGFLLAFSTMQITLTFHSESLRQAFRDHWRFFRRHWWGYTWFLALAGLHFYVLHALHLTMKVGLGEGTAAGIAWQLLFPWLAAIVAAWLLASWVCFFKRCDTGRRANENWIAF
jgi:hypothetical protein